MPKRTKLLWISVAVLVCAVILSTAGYFFLHAATPLPKPAAACGTSPSDVIIVMDNSNLNWSENQKTVATSIVNKLEANGGIGAGRQYRVSIVKNTLLGQDDAQNVYVGLGQNMTAADLITNINKIILGQTPGATYKKLSGLINIAGRHMTDNARTNDNLRRTMFILTGAGDQGGLLNYDPSINIPLNIDPIYPIVTRIESTNATEVTGMKTLARPSTNYLELSNAFGADDTTKIEATLSDFVAGKSCEANQTLTGKAEKSPVSMQGKYHHMNNHVTLDIKNNWTGDWSLPKVLYRIPKDVFYNEPNAANDSYTRIDRGVQAAVTIDQVKAICALMTGKNLKICSDLLADETTATNNYNYYQWDLGGLPANTEAIMRFLVSPASESAYNKVYDFSSFTYLSGSEVIDPDYSDNQFNSNIDLRDTGDIESPTPTSTLTTTPTVTATVRPTSTVVPGTTATVGATSTPVAAGATTTPTTVASSGGSSTTTTPASAPASGGGATMAIAGGGIIGTIIIIALFLL